MNRMDTSSSSRKGMSGFIIGPLLLLLACWFLWGFDITNLPKAKPISVNKSYLSIEPRRQALGDPPVIHLNGYDRTCMDCHKLFPPRANPPTRLFVHDHVKLNHGINDQCRNCHDLENRDRLVLRGNKTIPFTDSVLLCANCHGPTYRDWERGMHGRSQGFWDKRKGDLKRLDCVDCHDPHSPREPAMLPVAPLPAPSRPHQMDGHGHLGGHGHMSDQGEQHEAEESDPLRRTIMEGVQKGRGQ